MFVVNRDVVITNGTNRTVIVPIASGTLNHRSYGHIPILTMMTWFRGLLLNDAFSVRLANTFCIITFRLTFLAVTTVATVAVIITYSFVLSINLFFRVRVRNEVVLILAEVIATVKSISCQEPITRSLHTNCTLESTLSRIFLFLEL